MCRLKAQLLQTERKAAEATKHLLISGMALWLQADLGGSLINWDRGVESRLKHEYVSAVFELAL
jgi:hypothetical protein